MDALGRAARKEAFIAMVAAYHRRSGNGLFCWLKSTPPRTGRSSEQCGSWRRKKGCNVETLRKWVRQLSVRMSAWVWIRS